MAPSPSPPGTAAHSFSSSDPGFEALPLVPVLALHQGLLARIKLCFGADRATFERDLHAVHDRAELGRIFTALCEQVAQDLQRKGYAGRTIGIKLRYADFRGATRDQTIAQATQDAAMLRRVAGQCLKRVPLQQRLRLLGVRVASLVPVAEAALHPAAAHSPGPAQGETLGLF